MGHSDLWSTLELSVRHFRSLFLVIRHAEKFVGLLQVDTLMVVTINLYFSELQWKLLQIEFLGLKW